MNGIAVAFEGRLGQDSELRFTSNGNAMLSFSCAVETERAKDGQPAPSEWIRVVLFGEEATDLVSRLGRGDAVYVEGRLSLRRFQGNDGQEHASLNVVASLVQPMGKIGRQQQRRQANGQNRGKHSNSNRDSGGRRGRPARSPPRRASASTLPTLPELRHLREDGKSWPVRARRAGSARNGRSPRPWAAPVSPTTAAHRPTC